MLIIDYEENFYEISQYKFHFDFNNASIDMRNAYSGYVKSRWPRFHKGGQICGLVLNETEEYFCFSRNSTETPHYCYSLYDNSELTVTTEISTKIHSNSLFLNRVICGIERKPQSDSFKVNLEFTGCNENMAEIDWHFKQEDPPPIRFNDSKQIYILNTAYLFMINVSGDCEKNCATIRIALKKVFHCAPGNPGLSKF